MAKSDFWMLHRLRVRFSEVDSQAIVYNANYITYFNIGLGEYHRNLPYDRVAANNREGAALHVVRAEVEYKAPLRFDEEIDIGARIVRLGRTSATFAYEIYRVADEQLAATGGQVWVHVNKASQIAVPWPEDFVTIVRRREGARLRSD
jgi:acyl-CoA thioester hydrolase